MTTGTIRQRNGSWWRSATGDAPTSPDARSLHGTDCAAWARRTGLRRVDWVRLFEGADRGEMHAQVSGVGFRLPVTRTISVPLAAELIASGAPFVVHRRKAGR